MILLNWKANGSKELIWKYNLLDVQCNKLAIFLPLYLVNEALSAKFYLGSQDVSQFNNGAYTGEITAQMLSEMGMKYCLVGHSERRQCMKEDNEIIAKKIERLIESKITPVLCVGEGARERKNKIWKDVLQSQLSIFKKECIIAYEPVWAIGTGVTPTNEEIDEVINWIKQSYNDSSSLPLVLYGGSVSSKNIAEISRTKADGVLVGGASLKAEEVLEISKYF